MSVIVPYTANDLAITDAFERELMADSARETFVIMRDVLAEDTGGGFTPTPTVVAMGQTQLRLIGNDGNERVVANRLGWSIAFAMEIEKPVTIKTTDTFTLNTWRKFEIGAVIDLGHGSTQLTLVVRERG